MLANLLAAILGECLHPRYTWPQTREGKTTCCCLACGKELAYDWSRMKVVKLEANTAA